MPSEFNSLHRRDDEVVSPRGKPYPFRRVEQRCGIDERGDHQAVPISENLVVAAGANPLFPRVEQALPQRREPCLLRKCRRLCFEAVQDDNAPAMRVVFPIAAWRGVIEFAKKRRVLWPKQGLDFSIGPNIELAFDSLAVGIETGAERAFDGGHFAPEPRNRFARPRAEKRAAKFVVAKPQKLEDLGIVIEHFFKMRHEPSFVGRIARITAAEVIVDAAFGHFGQRQFDEIAVGSVGKPCAGAPEQFENGRIRKFRRPGRAAMDGVDNAGDLRRETIDLREGYPAAAGYGGFRKLAADDFCILRDPRGLRPKGFGNGF